MSRHALAEQWDWGPKEADHAPDQMPRLEVASVASSDSEPGSDAELVSALQGKPGSLSRNEDFTALYARHHAMVQRVLALRGIQSQADREDVAQQVWMNVLRGIGRFRGDTAFASWLHRIARNEAIDFLRRRTMRAIVGSESDEEGQTLEFPDHRQPTPLQEVLVDELAGRINAIPRKTPRTGKQPPLRDILKLLADGATRPEIAAVFEVPEGTASIWRFRARQLVRDLLRKDYPEVMALARAA